MLPPLDVAFPSSLDEALSLLRDGARVLGGGTDLIPSLVRRTSDARRLVSLSRIEGLDRIATGDSIRIGARVTLARLIREVPVLARTAKMIASPQIRNVATIGGNLCLDTRCVYLNQSEHWRGANGFCFKTNGDVCHVVAGGKNCVATASADLPPLLIALGATIDVIGANGVRTLPLEQLYSNDGAAPISLQNEILIAVNVPRGARGVYRKLRLRRAIDFPLVGIALADPLRLVATGVAPAPRVVKLDDLRSPVDVEEVAARAEKALRPIDTITTDRAWRRAMVPMLVREAFAELGHR